MFKNLIKLFIRAKFAFTLRLKSSLPGVSVQAVKGVPKKNRKSSKEPSQSKKSIPFSISLSFLISKNFAPIFLKIKENLPGL